MSEQKKDEIKKVASSSKDASELNLRDLFSRKRFADRPKEEFEQRILDIARVTRVMKEERG